MIKKQVEAVEAFLNIMFDENVFRMYDFERYFDPNSNMNLDGHQTNIAIYVPSIDDQDIDTLSIWAYSMTVLESQPELFGIQHINRDKFLEWLRSYLYPIVDITMSSRCEWDIGNAVNHFHLDIEYIHLVVYFNMDTFNTMVVEQGKLMNWVITHPDIGVLSTHLAQRRIERKEIYIAMLEMMKSEEK